MVSRRKLAVSIGVVAVAAVSLLAASWAGAQSKATYPRQDTLITAGTQWGTIAGFNPYGGSYAQGMVGFVNETLLRFDPLTDKYIPWLAKSAKFTSPRVFVIKVRPGVKWSNGQTFKGSDVVFNIKLGRTPTASWNVLYQNLKSVTAKGNTVTVKFKTTEKVGKKGHQKRVKTGPPNYVQWQNLMFTLPMMNPTQYAGINKKNWTSFSPTSPIGTGPYTLAALDSTTRIVWKKKAVWWAAKQKVSPSPKPTYIIDLCNDNNTTALSGLLTGILDLDNNYIPGINKYVANGKMQTYFPKAPYNLAANTAWLTPNTKHKPLNDKNFRKALAYSINVSSIVSNDYHNLVTKASPTGLLKVWSKWINKAQVKKFGFTYSVAKAKALLKSSGYKTGSDGYVLNKDGSKINLKIAVPSGWSDWETAEGLIVNSAKAAGIKITIDVGDYNHYVLQRNAGQFDLLVENSYQISDNPWTYFNGLFHLPIIGTQSFANFSRYSNKAAWALVKKLDRTPLGNIKARATIMNTLEKYELVDVPNIPLWYNGIWAQTQSKIWTNWPSSTSNRHYLPCTWRGYQNMTAIDMYTHVKKA